MRRSSPTEGKSRRSKVPGVRNRMDPDILLHPYSPNRDKLRTPSPPCVPCVNNDCPSAKYDVSSVSVVPESEQNYPSLAAFSSSANDSAAPIGIFDVLMKSGESTSPWLGDMTYTSQGPGDGMLSGVFPPRPEAERRPSTLSMQTNTTNPSFCNRNQSSEVTVNWTTATENRRIDTCQYEQFPSTSYSEMFMNSDGYYYATSSNTANGIKHFSQVGELLACPSSSKGHFAYDNSHVLTAYASEDAPLRIGQRKENSSLPKPPLRKIPLKQKRRINQQKPNRNMSAAERALLKKANQKANTDAWREHIKKYLENAEPEKKYKEDVLELLKQFDSRLNELVNQDMSAGLHEVPSM